MPNIANRLHNIDDTMPHYCEKKIILIKKSIKFKVSPKFIFDNTRNSQRKHIFSYIFSTFIPQ